MKALEAKTRAKGKEKNVMTKTRGAQISGMHEDIALGEVNWGMGKKESHK